MMSQPVPIQPVEISKPEVSYYKKEVQAGLKRQRREFIERIGYTDLIKYLEGQQGKDTWTVVDEFSPAILSVVSSVYYQNPTVNVEATTPESDGYVKPSLMYLMQNPDFKPYKLSELMEGASIYGMKKAGMKEEMQVACFDLILAGYCAVEMNHTAEQPEAPTQDFAAGENRESPILDKVVEGAKGLLGGVKDMLGMGKSEKADDEVAEEVAQTTQKDIRVDSSNQTYCKRWNPLDIIFDPRAEVFKESRWVAKKVRMTLAEFNARYPHLKGKVNVGDEYATDIMYSEHVADENKKGVVLYEIEIKKKGPRNCVLVLHMGMDEAVDYYERPIVSNNFAIKYGCIDKYGKIYPMSRGKKAKRPQDDINHYMTIQFEHVDRAQRKIAVYTQGLTESGKAAQNSSDPYAIVEKNTPQSVYEVMPAPSVVLENKEIVVKATDSLNKIIGTTELAKSGESQNDTLGQDQLQTQAFQVNVNAVQDALGDMADQLLDELKDIIMQTWDGQDYFKVTGIKGGDAWYSPEMGPLADLLIGDFAINSNITSAARPDPMKDRADQIEYTKFITSPDMVAFAQMHGKRPSMEVLNTLSKKFGQNPEMVFEDLAPMPMPGQPEQVLPPQSPMPPTPNAQLVEPEGNRINEAAANYSDGGGNAPV